MRKQRLLIWALVKRKKNSRLAHVCIPTVIAASLAISCDSSSFSSYCSDRISKRQREGEEIEASICIASCNSFFSLHEHYFSNPNGKDVWNWISNALGNVVLPRQFWVSAGKEKAMMRSVFLSAWTWFQNFQRWEFLEMSFEPRAQISQRSNG